MGRPRLEDPVRFCEWCGAQLARKRFRNSLESRHAFASRLYCDRKCMAQGFTSPTAKPAALRRRAAAFRGTRCEACGTTEKTMHAHHIDGNLQNDSRENIQTLCASCHSRHHRRARREGKKVAGRLDPVDRQEWAA